LVILSDHINNIIIGNTLNSMANMRGFLERDGRGRERIVLRPISRGRSASHGRRTTTELLNESEEREATLAAENNSLRTQLSYAQNAQYQLQKLEAEHYQCRSLQAQLEAQQRAFNGVQDLLEDEQRDNRKLEHKIEKLEERLRLMKRGSGENYRTRYEEVVADNEAWSLEVERLKVRLAEKEDTIRLQDISLRSKNDELNLRAVKILEKNDIIAQLKDALERRGYRVR